MGAYLVLEDGSVFEGFSGGAFGETVCEVVFNTSMTGYVEILTDPSYAGQGIVMTYPMIGNYGIQREDFESGRLQPKAFIVRELCSEPSNFRCEGTIDSLLKEHGIPCLYGADTRAIVKKLRNSGTMRGVITEDISNMARIVSLINEYKHEGLVESVSLGTKRVLGTGNTGPKIALIDCGAKMNIAASLVKRGCEVTEYPCDVSAEEIIASKPDGLMLSNGPGDPEACTGTIKEIKKLYDYDMPTFAICLGHQLMALAVGGSTERMKFGHRGANHPVKFINRDKTYLSSQNHGYMVSPAGLPANAEVNCINVNDGTVEGIVYHGKKIFTVQFHPEANSGPRDTAFLFDDFIKMIKEGVVNA
ncbi:MAG: carbamoyl phosphate synthase small subunit [Clostridiales bacterium]|nr:carbamoyl phosphate synthase small subunit [Clostridiales bacterium]